VAIPSRKAFVDALVRAGFVSANDLNSIQKITITIDASSQTMADPVRVDIVRLGDASLIKALDEFKED